MSDYLNQKYAESVDSMSSLGGPSTEEIQQMLLNQDINAQAQQAGQEVVTPELDPTAGARTAAYTQQLQQVGIEPQAIGPGIVQGQDVLQQTLDTIRENPTLADSLGVRFTDFIDNTFQGDQKTPEQIAAEVDQRRAEVNPQYNIERAESRKEFIDNSPEAARVAIGAVTGAGEAVGSTGALVADTVAVGVDELFPSLELDIDEERNPFSNKYEAFVADFGSDRMAQTGVGKVAQGFGEFGVLMAATGGFGGGSALQGGIRGLAADLMQPPEDGNLSNLIKENAPEWYPTWLTALAVEEGENPWVSRLKTALEGFGLGVAAEGAVNYVRVRQITKGLVKSGMSPEDAAAKALKQVRGEDIAREAQRATTGFAEPEPATMWTKLKEIKEMDPEGYWSVDLPSLEDLGRAKRIQVDGGFGAVKENGDITAVFKDPSSNRKGVADQILQAAVKEGGDRLDNFDTYLTPIYERNGFKVAGRMPFSEEYAPKGWNKELHGTPDVVAMVYDPHGRIVIDEPVVWDSYDEMISYRDALIDASPSELSIKQQFARKLNQAKGGPEPEYASAHRAQRLSNGTEVEWRFYRDAIGSDPQLKGLKTVDGAGVVDVAWDASGEIGTEGKRLMTEFQRMARDEMEPGTILFNSPASNSYAKGGASDAQIRKANAGVDPREANIRAKLYERAGFGKASGAAGDLNQYAVVRAFPDEKGRWIAPLDIENLHKMQMQYDAVTAPQGKMVDYDQVARAHRELFERGEFTPDGPMMDRIIAAQEVGEEVMISPHTGANIPYGWAARIDAVPASPGFDALPEWMEQAFDGLTRSDAAIRITGDGNVELWRVFDDPQRARKVAEDFDLSNLYDVGGRQIVDAVGGDDILPTNGSTLNSYSNRPANPVPPGEGRVVRLVDDVEMGSGRIGDVNRAVDSQSTASASGLPERGNGTSVLSTRARELTAGSDEASRKVIDEMAREMDSQFLWGTGKTWESIRQDAQNFLNDWNGNINAIPVEKTSQGDVFLTPEYMVAVKTAMMDISTSMADKAYNVVKGSADYLDVTESFEQLATDLKALAKLHKLSAQHYGLGLGSMKIPALGIEIPASAMVKPSSKQAMEATEKMITKSLDEMVAAMKSGDPAAVREAARTANFIMMAGGEVDKIRTVAQYARRLATDDALALMYNSMLSGPPTHVVNTVSNLFNTLYRPVTAAIGGNATDRKMAAAAYMNLMENIQEAWGVASRAFMTGDAVNDGGKGLVKNAQATAQLEALVRDAEISGNVGAYAIARSQQLMHWFVNTPIIDLPSRFLTGSDEFFKTMAARMEFNARTMQEAIETGGDNVDDVFKSLLDKRKAASFDPATGAILDENLLKVAQETTFQQPLEGKMAAFQHMVEEVPALRIFFPFIKTGHNIMVYTGSHMPLVNRLLKEHQAVMKGTDEYAKAVMRGREAFGYITLATAGTMYATGNLTGNGPMDPGERKQWLKNNRPRSFRVPGTDTWIDYSRIEPFGMILSTVADIADAVSANKMTEKDASYLMGQIGYIIGMNMTQKTFFQGMTPLSMIASPQRTTAERMAMLPAEVINNFIPYAGARRAITNMMNPYMQEVGNEMDRLLHSASGGMLGDAATKYDWLTGEAITANSGGWNALSPVKFHARKQNRVKDALEDIGFEFDDVFKEVGDVKLTASQRSQIQKIMGNSSLQKELEEFIPKGEKWDTMVEQYQAAVRSGHVDKRDLAAYRDIMDIVRRYKRYATDHLRDIDPEFAAQYEDSINAREAAGSMQGVQELLQFYRGN